jgi:hypothetical protein
MEGYSLHAPQPTELAGHPCPGDIGIVKAGALRVSARPNTGWLLGQQDEPPRR